MAKHTKPIKESVWAYCRRNRLESVLMQWHPVRNRGVTPDEVPAGSHRHVWWMCKQGHEWQAEVRCRTLYGNGCPFCANRAVLPGFNDLATLYPELAAEWHPTKNGALTPEQVLAGSEKRVWWQCGRGHAWQTSVSTRTRANCRCPVCAGRTVLAGENDLATLSPELAAEWHPTLNGALTPDMVTAGSNGTNNPNGGNQASIEVSGKISTDPNAVNKPTDEEKPSEMVKKVRTTSDYFNTLAQNEQEPKLIKAIIDENVKATDGSRVRLRLLDDVEINEHVVKRGSYLYATMSGFASQRVKGSISSIMIDDELVKVSLSLYDTDGLEGLYVPSSQFRETTKDVASGAVSGNINMNTSGTGSSFSQWGMQAMQNAYQKTSNAIGKAIKKNKVKLKYGTFVYIINSKETKK